MNHTKDIDGSLPFLLSSNFTNDFIEFTVEKQRLSFLLPMA